jgi:S-adenosylmethionine synthetase
LQWGEPEVAVIVQLILRPRNDLTPDQQDVEVVERKGLGHPDTICDAVAEHVSRRLCRFYLEKFGTILHHNVDKVLLCGGSARVAFGGGEVLEPMEIYLAGRATNAFKGVPVPVADIAVDACREWLKRHLSTVDVERHVKIIPRLRPGSAELTALFSRPGSVLPSNDTSCGVGFAPLTDLERVVLAVEKELNSFRTRSTHPAIGEDIKVMGVRKARRIELTVGCAFISLHVADIDAYEHEKEIARAIAVRTARSVTSLDVEAVVNAADDLARGELYLTVTGTSAEAGDDGEVGRGNRANGLITPYRPMTLEAAAGKNPVNHVGKLYNVLAGWIAQALVGELPEVRDATCVLVSRIGRAVTDPHIADIRLALDDSAGLETLRPRAAELVRAGLGRVEELRNALLEGRVTVY